MCFALYFENIKKVSPRDYGISFRFVVKLWLFNGFNTRFPIYAFHRNAFALTIFINQMPISEFRFEIASSFFWYYCIEVVSVYCHYKWRQSGGLPMFNTGKPRTYTCHFIVYKVWTTQRKATQFVIVYIWAFASAVILKPNWFFIAFFGRSFE